MTLHILPRPSALIFDYRTGRRVHPDTAAAYARFDSQRHIYNDRIAALVVEAENVLIAVAADLAKIEEGADATDAESCLIRRALVRRAGAAILRFRRPEMVAAQTGGAR